MTDLLKEIDLIRAELEQTKEDLLVAKKDSASFSLILDSIPFGVVFAGKGGEIDYVNQKMMTLMGFPSRDDLIGKHFFSLTNTHGLKKAASDIIPELQRSGQWTGELPLIKENGEILRSDLCCVLQQDSKGVAKSMVATFRDLTEQEQISENLRQAQKMEAVGTLAGGVAHDMNNVLGAILTLAAMVKEDTSTQDPHIQDIVDIISAARRGKDLTQNLLGFARKGKYLRERISISELLEEMQSLLSHTLPKTVRIQLLHGDAQFLVEGDHGQLLHAFMNVCLNSADAMNNKGTITCTIKNATISDVNSNNLTENSIPPPGSYLLVEVIDNGVGMNEHVLSRALEPFFTTKEASNGTGLGLPMVYGTVKNHGGAMNIDSEPGSGTKVSIYLPITMDESTPRRFSGFFKTAPIATGGLVLVVDDEDMIRRSVQRLLVRLGYDVVLASNGLEGLEIIKDRKDELRLIILDLIMPLMDGEDTFKQAQQISPEIPILISSGFASDGMVERLMNAGAAGFLAKPFEIETFANEVALLARKI